MTNVPVEASVESLQAFAEAWNRHDIDALMSFMTDDSVFGAPAGPDVCGCDLFTFRNGKIALKNSYRKNRPPLATAMR